MSRQIDVVSTDRVYTKLNVIIALLTIIGLIGGVLLFLANNAADVREVKAEQERIRLEIAKLETRLESALSAMNPVLLDIQSRMVRIETQLEMVLENKDSP